MYERDSVECERFVCVLKIGLVEEAIVAVLELMYMTASYVN